MDSNNSIFNKFIKLFLRQFLAIYRSNVISIETQFSVLMFVSVLTQLDNFCVYHKINSLAPNNEAEHIRIIGEQAIEILRNKLNLHRLTKITEKPLVLRRSGSLRE